MEEKEIKMRHEVYGDYDWILYHEYEDGTMVNVHTWTTFDELIQKEKYWYAYQFLEGKLVGFSVCRAEGLSVSDDLNLSENQLWWTRMKDGSHIFKPVKSLSYGHIKNILRDVEDNTLHVNPSILAYFNSIFYK